MLAPTDITSAIRLCAIAGAVKAKLTTDAKAIIPEGTSHNVDITARIMGTVSKGRGEPPASGVAVPVVSLTQPGVTLDVLRRLKITPSQLKSALRAATKHIAAPGELGELGQGVIAQDLAAVYEQVTAELVRRLPAEPWERPGRAGPVTTQVTVEILPTSESKRCVAKAA